MANSQKKRLLWRSFEEAQSFVHDLGLKTKREWQTYCHSGCKPEDIPSAPEGVYHEQFTSYGNWLGSGTISNHKRVFRPFEEGRAFVHRLGLKNLHAWQAYCRSGHKPKDIPSNPNQVYQTQFLSYGDWLGSGTISTQRRVFRPFEEARLYVRSLGLKSLYEWQTYCRSGRKPDDIPSAPEQSYRDHFLDYGDWLGIAHRWSKKRLLALLTHLQQSLPLLTEKELSMIILQEDVAPQFHRLFGQRSPVQVLTQHVPEIGGQTSSSHSPQVALVDDHPLHAKTLAENDACAETVSLSPLAEGTEERQDVATAQAVEAPTFISQAYLQSLDQLTLSIDVNAGVVDYLVNNRVNRLWEVYSHTGWSPIEPLLAGDGGPFFTEIKERFLRELHAVETLPLPAGWSFRNHRGQLAFPNAMQRRTAWEVSEKRRVGNWSGTGAGKTLAAILASRVIAARITLIVTNCAAREGWCRHLRLAFPESVVMTNEQSITPRLVEGASLVYFVLNYEKFQQPNRQVLIWRLLRCHLDFVIFDEIQFIKQRSRRASKRRNALEMLLNLAGEQNPHLRVLGMSATPVMNSLQEGKKLLELIIGQSLPDLKSSRQTVTNALSLHRALMQYGFRVRHRCKQTAHIQTIPVIRNDLQERVSVAQGTILQMEQVLLPAKLDVIDQWFHPGTIIYTQYVDRMIDPICVALTARGYTVGRYIGNDKSGLEHFLDGTTDILVGSSSLGTGLDGLQTVCRTMIFLSLPWTSAEFEQIIGRIQRQGSRFERVEIVIPQVLFSQQGETWSWDQLRMG